MPPQFSPDGTRIVTTSDDTHRAHVWDAKTGAALATLLGGMRGPVVAQRGIQPRWTARASSPASGRYHRARVGRQDRSAARSPHSRGIRTR